jgi:hypothetical protein
MLMWDRVSDPVAGQSPAVYNQREAAKTGRLQFILQPPIV